MIRQSVEGQPYVNKGWSFTRSRDGASNRKPARTRSGMVDTLSRSWTIHMHQAGGWLDNGARSHEDCGIEWRRCCLERECVMDDFYHLHSFILWLKTLSQFHKLATQACHCGVQGDRGGGLDRDLG